MNTNHVSEFEKYLKRDIDRALEELEKFVNNKSRVHIQKLVFSSIADRFDYMIDGLIMDNCREKFLVLQALNNRKEKKLRENDILQVFLDDEEGIQAFLEEKVKERLDSEVCKKRHSLKLATLLELFTQTSQGDLKMSPRVNPATGNILPSNNPKKKTSPLGICGYADWLYCRRNGIVHGNGRQYTELDKAQMRAEYNFDLPESFKISLGSIRVASCFYKDVCKLIKG